MKELAGKVKMALRSLTPGRLPILKKFKKIKTDITNLTYFINIIDKNERIGW